MRFRRILLNLAAAVSLLILIAIIVLWPRSYRHPTYNSIGWQDSFSFTRQDPLYWYISSPGKAVFCRQTGRDWNGRNLPGFSFLGVEFGGTQGPSGDSIWNLRIPFWLLTVCSAPLPAIALLVWRRDRRRRRLAAMGRCARCGYDLRATPTRCPECGYEVAAVAMKEA